MRLLLNIIYMQLLLAPKRYLRSLLDSDHKLLGLETRRAKSAARSRSAQQQGSTLPLLPLTESQLGGAGGFCRGRTFAKQSPALLPTLFCTLVELGAVGHLGQWKCNIPVKKISLLCLHLMELGLGYPGRKLHALIKDAHEDSEKLSGGKGGTGDDGKDELLADTSASNEDLDAGKNLSDSSSSSEEEDDKGLQDSSNSSSSGWEKERAIIENFFSSAKKVAETTGLKGGSEDSNPTKTVEQEKNVEKDDGDKKRTALDDSEEGEDDARVVLEKKVEKQQRSTWIPPTKNEPTTKSKSPSAARNNSSSIITSHRPAAVSFPSMPHAMSRRRSKLCKLAPASLSANSQFVQSRGHAPESRSMWATGRPCSKTGPSSDSFWRQLAAETKSDMPSRRCFKSSVSSWSANRTWARAKV